MCRGSGRLGEETLTTGLPVCTGGSPVAAGQALEEGKWLTQVGVSWGRGEKREEADGAVNLLPARLWASCVSPRLDGAAREGCGRQVAVRVAAASRVRRLCAGAPSDPSRCHRSTKSPWASILHLGAKEERVDRPTRPVPVGAQPSVLAGPCSDQHPIGLPKVCGRMLAPVWAGHEARVLVTALCCPVCVPVLPWPLQLPWEAQGHHPEERSLQNWGRAGAA